MKMGMKLILVIMLLVSIVSLDNLDSQAEEVRGVTDDTIKIGTIMDMTGPVADNLTPYVIGVRNYFKYINDIGGNQWQEGEGSR